MPIDMAFAAAGYGLFMVYGLLRGLLSRRYSCINNRCQRPVRYYPQLGYLHHRHQRLQVLLIGFSFGALLEGALALAHRWRLPVRCWWVWASNAIRGGAVSDCQHCAGGVWCVGVPILVAGQVTGIDPFDIGQWRDVSYRSCRFLCRSGW